MAVVNTIPELWRATLKRQYAKANIWSNQVTDVSSEFSVGDTLHIQEITSAGTIHDYTNFGDLPDPEQLSDSDETMVIDQKKAFNIAIDDIEKVQAKPDVMGRFTENTMEAMARVIDTDIADRWQNAAAFATSGANQNQIGAKAISEASSSTDLAAFIKAVNQIVRIAENAAVPRDRLTMIINTNVAAGIRQYLITAGSVGALSDSTLVRGAMISLFGINVVVDPNASNASANGTPLAKFVDRSALLMAMQIRKVEGYRPEKKFADALKGLFVWGRHLLYPNRRFMIVAQSG